MKILNILNAIQLFVGTALLLLATYAFRYKENKVRKSLIIFLILAAFWCFFSVIVMNVDGFTDKILFNRIRLLAPIFLPACVLTLALNLNGEIKINKIYLFVLPCIWGIVVLSPWHELFINNYNYVMVGGRQLLTYKNGPLFMVHNVLSRLFCIASFFIIIKGMKGRHRFQKITGWMIIFAIALPFIVDTIAVHFYENFRYLQIVPISLGVTSILMSYALLVHGSLELIPYARSQIFSYLSEPCLMWDQKGMLVDCNPSSAKLLSIPSDIRTFDLVSTKYLKLNGHEILWNDGRIFQIRFEEIEDLAGNIMGSFTLMREITSVKIAEKKLIQMNHVKTNILGILSHDLCGHTGQLSLMIELLMLNHKELQEVEKMELTEGAFFLSKDLNLFLSNLLDWSKEQFDDWDMKKEPVAVKELMDEVCSFLSKSATLKKQNIVNEIPANFILETDVKMLEIIMRNLVYNAIKHSEVDSTIKISGNDFGIGVWNQGDLDASDVELINQYFSNDGVEAIPNSGLGHKICKEFSKILNMQIIAKYDSNGIMFSLIKK